MSERIVQMILKNGLRVVVQPIKNLRSVGIIVFFRGGARYETRKTNGLFHFQEHMFFRGGKRYVDQQAVCSAIDQVGGTQNASTSYEYVSYEANVPAREAALAFDVLSDMLLCARFLPEDIDQERGAVLMEIAGYDDDAYDHADRVMRGILYSQECSRGWDLTGLKENIRRFQREDFIDLRDDFYFAENSVIGVSGGMDAKEALLLAERYFSKLPQRPAKAVIVPPFVPYLGEQRIAYKHLEREEAVVLLAVPAPPRGGGKHLACNVVASALGSGMSSRLFLDVRTKHGLAYDVSCWYDDESRDHGMLYMYAGVGSRRIPEAVERIIETCRSMATRPDADEHRRTLSQLRGEREMRCGRSLSTAARVGKQALLDGFSQGEDEYIEEHDRVTFVAMTEMAEELFQPQNFKLALAGPVTDATVDEIQNRVPELR